MVDLADTLIDINILAQPEPDVLETLNQIDTLLTDDRQAFVNALKSVTDYTLDVYGQINETILMHLNSLITGEALTVEEMFILKDEIHVVLDETLPSIEDYENVYTVYALMLTLFSDDAEATVDEEHITTLASMAHYSNQIFIDFIGDIDVQVYNDVMLIVTDLYSPGYCESTENYDYVCYGPQYDMPKIVELILYIDQFFTDFNESHQTTIDELNNLQTEEYKSKTYALIENMMITALENAYAGDPQLNQMTAFIEDIFDNIAIFEDAFAVYQKLGENTYHHFIETQGQILIDIDHFINSVNETTDPETLANNIENIFSQFLGYYNITAGEVTKEDLTSLIKMTMYTVELSLIQTGVPIDLDNLIETLPPVLANIIYPFIEVQTDFFNNMEENNVISRIFSYEGLTLYERIMAEFIITLDQTLTPEAQNKLNSSVESLFTDVLSDPTILIMLQLTEEEVIDVQMMVHQSMGEFFTQLELVATYDFENLTPEQQFEVARLLIIFGSISEKKRMEFPEDTVEVYLNTTTEEDLPEGDIDFFKFVLTEATRVKIYSTSSIYTKGYLYDEFGTLIVERIGGGENFNFLIEHELDPGTYYIKVERHGEYRFGNYLLHVEELEPDLKAFANIANWFGEVAYGSIPHTGDNEVGDYIEVTIEQLVTEGQLPAATFNNFTGSMRFEVTSNGYYNPVSFFMESDTLYVSRTGTVDHPINTYFSSDDVIIK